MRGVLLAALLAASVPASAPASVCPWPCGGPASRRPDVPLYGFEGDASLVVFVGGGEEVAAEVAGAWRDEDACRRQSGVYVIPARPLRANTGYAVVAPSPSEGVSRVITRFRTAAGEERRPAWPSEPRLVAEHVVDGRRALAFVAPEDGGARELLGSFVCPDGHVEEAFDGVMRHPGGRRGVWLACRDGGEPVALVLRFADPARGRSFSLPRKLVIPPRGVLPEDVRAGARMWVREVPPWRPSLGVGLALFGALPFALGYACGAVWFRRRNRVR